MEKNRGLEWNGRGFGLEATNSFPLVQFLMACALFHAVDLDDDGNLSRLELRAFIMGILITLLSFFGAASESRRPDFSGPKSKIKEAPNPKSRRPDFSGPKSKVKEAPNQKVINMKVVWIAEIYNFKVDHFSFWSHLDPHIRPRKNLISVSKQAGEQFTRLF
ncbi:hypothetical protein KSP39_PZI019011 [Platanthera zijinensis]|uniref:EF-hand domain-containing protein n=1 Tax=Platanthera zijinensis TaxID=2320716 RepID=A0AAP0B3H6_9ASPA